MKTQQAAEREEQQRIKNLVLNYDLREGEDLDGNSSLATSSSSSNIHNYNAGAEKAAGANYARVDKSSNNRSGQRARKLQLSDVDWYDHPQRTLSHSPVTRHGNVSFFKHARGKNASMKQQPDHAVNSGHGFSVTQPRQPPQSSKALPKTTGKGRLTRREIFQEHASRIAAKADAEK